MDEIAYSRPGAVATKLLGHSAAFHLLLQPVLLTADAAALQTLGARSAFLAALSLLTRFCADVFVATPRPTGRFVDVAQRLAERIRYAGKITFVDPATVSLDGFKAILNVGSTVRADLPWTSVAADGWAIQICSGSGNIQLDFTRFNPATTLAAASLGASEVFKRLLGAVPPFGQPFIDEAFSLLTYTPSLDPGPDIRAPLRLDTVLIGHGAIGNGIRHVLLELPLEGWLAIIDKQEAAEENWGTYIGLARAGFGQPKAELAAQGWSSSVQPFPFPMDVSALRDMVGRRIPYPRVTLGALDNIDARHAIQELWPDVAIDGAIGDITCQVSRHPWGPDTACLRCLFRPPPGEDSAVATGRVTGLSVIAASRQEEMVTEADVETAPAEKKSWLAARVGQQRCSVIREAFAAELTAGATRFSPSAPFVACMSGAMVAGEFVKLRMNIETPLDPRFQFNVLIGPRAGNLLDQGRSQGCFCVERAGAVRRWREAALGFALQKPAEPAGKLA